ncbi:MAG: PilZ domain-containing protein [Sulfuricaulis sp.]
MSAKPLKTKPAERRRAAREVLAQQPQGRLQLYTKFQCLDVVEIGDVSPFGIGLRLNVSIDDDAPIRLMYAGENIQIDVAGTVVWKRPVRLPEPNPFAGYGCWVGIFLHPDNLDANFELYRALKGETP